MILSFTDTFGLDKDAFDETGAYDPVIGVDSRLFIDPALLDQCGAPEFDGARDEVEQYFGVIITLLSGSEHQNDLRWKKAENLLTFTEIRGTSLGYCGKGNAGAGIGPKLRRSILESARILIEDGMKNPTIFELLGVFEEDVGPDRISDLITHILRRRIARYTERVATQSGFQSHTVLYEGSRVPKHPIRSEPILLLPQDVLSPLPLAMNMGDIDYVCAFNAEVRRVINEYFPWDEVERRKPTKAQIKELMIEHPEFAKALVEAYVATPGKRYDFTVDNKGERSWYPAGRKLAEENPLDMNGIDGSNPKEVARLVCAQFKQLVENNGAWRLLYDEKSGKPRTERYAQCLFLVVASAYCDANGIDIDVSPEPNSGNGPVDFKLSRGRVGKCIVELKMSSSGRLRHCIDSQIPTYMQAERAKHALYLLVQTGNEEHVEEFVRYYKSLPSSVHSDIELMVVDARSKQSASKR